ncbi:hypothetical protein AAC387_Pa06g2079 [Persea americana]
MAMASTFLSNNSLGSGLNTKATTSSAWPLHQQRSQVSGGVRRRHSLRQSLLISCKGGRDADNAVPFIDRRNMLIGLGGLYGAASSIGFDAVAAPIAPPDLSKCGPADLPAGAIPTNCCPPFNDKIVDFKFPSFTKMRVRPAAHRAADDKEYMEKFTKAVKLMRELPKDDPRNFTQQANVHCAYCDGAYDQVGFPNLELQVHNSWLFFPFHRCYLYFFERILGKLIGDESFAIPFWNWDAPKGMIMPPIYTDPSSSLYDRLRDAAHQPPKVIDLDYNGVDPTTTDRQQIIDNLTIMYRQMVSNARTPQLFLGSPYRAGDNPDPGAGSVENVPHGPVHVWTGDRTQPNGEDMGNFYSAARDPIFYAHHANVDRMWTLWRQMGGTHKDFTDSDWLDAGFLFYDENAQLVRVKVRDCLDIAKLGYSYQQVEVPWLKSRPTTRRVAGTASVDSAKKKADATDAASVFPRKLDSVLKVIVKRPKKSRSKKEKEEEDELLVIDQIEVGRDVPAKFDVFINVEDHKKHGPATSEFAGSFVNVAHKHKHSKKPTVLKTRLRLGITELLEDLGAEQDDEVVVTLVPRYGKDAITIGEVHIEHHAVS